MGIIIRQSIKSTIVNYVGAFIGFLVQMFIITRFLSSEEIGLTKVFLEVGILFASLCQLGTSASIMRYFPYFKNHSKNHNGFFFYILIVPLVGCCIFLPVYLLLKMPIIDFFAQNSPLFTEYYYWVIPLMLIICYWSVLESYSNVNMRIVVPKFNREIVLRLLMLVLYVAFGYSCIHMDGLIGGIVMAYAVVLIVTLIYVIHIAPTSLRFDLSYIQPSLRRSIFKYTIFLVTGALGGTMLARLDLFMITSELGFDDAGIFTIASYMAAVIEIPSRSITSISSPLAAEALKNNDFRSAEDLYKKVSLHQLLVGSIIFILVWINMDNIFAIMPNGHIYSAGKWVVFFIGVSKLISVALSFGGNLVNFSRYYYWGLYFMLFIIAIGIFTNMLFIPHYGITGAAIATLISTIASYAVQQWLITVKIKANPYTFGMLKTAFIIMVLILINSSDLAFENPWIDGITRSLITALIAIAMVYFMKVSQEVNMLIKSVARKILPL
ncbi:MAG: lipopolysaccharide biosynthesis protein [Culturomica sp.]|jgi:O-antigen/teichoic acid export membrane protein|nr:lipopolysaccharide biosynthesis protein [Culturomica sp.]